MTKFNNYDFKYSWFDFECSVKYKYHVTLRLTPSLPLWHLVILSLTPLLTSESVTYYLNGPLTLHAILYMQGEACGGKCAATRGCTNYVWTQEDGGTCFLKNGGAGKRAAVPLADSPGSVCGIVPKTDKVSISHTC